jgi:hypothetical protein
LSKGGFLTFMMMLSVTLVAVVVTTTFGTAALICSAAAFVVSPGIATSSWPACSAAVPRAALLDDHVPQPVEVGPALDEVVGFFT